MAQDVHARTLLRLGAGLLAASMLVAGATSVATASVGHSKVDPSVGGVLKTVTSPTESAPADEDTPPNPTESAPSETAPVSSPRPSKSTTKTQPRTEKVTNSVGDGAVTNQRRNPSSTQDRVSTVKYDPRTGFPLDSATGYAVHPRTGLLIVPTTGAMVARGSLAPSDYVYDFDARLVKLAPVESAPELSPSADAVVPSSAAPNSRPTAKTGKSTSQAPTTADTEPTEATRQETAASTQATDAASQSGNYQPIVNVAVGVVIVILGLWYFIVVFRRPQRRKR